MMAQSPDDALRYATYEAMGTARSMGIGNTISPLGGDFFTLSHNPAGLAAYRESEFTITPALQTTRSKAALGNNSTFEELDNDLMLSNLGLVIAHTNQGSKWKSVNFAIGYNRFTNYDQQTFYKGTSDGSITDMWLEEFQDFGTSLPYSAGLADNAGVFVEDQNGQVFTDYVLDGRGTLERQENLTSTGGAGEMAVGFGANYNHKFYFGATIGIPIINYESRRIYQEFQNEVSEDIYFNELEYSEQLSQSGAGINAKLGIAVRFNQAIRWSAYFHSPSVISILDEFSNSLEYSYYDNDRNIQRLSASYPEDAVTLNFDYEVITPSQVGTGLGIIIGKYGFISAEAAYRNYAHTRFNFDADLSTSEDLEYERELNQAIDDLYDDAWTFRFGGELALDVFRIRAGAILNQSPFADSDAFDPIYTGGVGLRFNRFFMDLAYRRTVRNASYLPYSVSDLSLYPEQEVNLKSVDSDFFLTLGFRF